MGPFKIQILGGWWDGSEVTVCASLEKKFQAPTESILQLPLTLAPGDLTPSSSLFGHAYTRVHTDTQIGMHNALISLYLKPRFVDF